MVKITKIWEINESNTKCEFDEEVMRKANNLEKVVSGFNWYQ